MLKRHIIRGEHRQRS